jgi:hypothetical protein
MREYWFRVEKNEFFLLLIFNVLGLFMAKKHDLSEQNFSVCHAPGPLPLLLPRKMKILVPGLI